MGEGDQRKYFRVLQHLDMSVEEQRKRIIEMIGEAVFKCLAVRITLDRAPDKGSDCASFIDELKEIPSLHFKAITSTTTASAAAPSTPETLPRADALPNS